MKTPALSILDLLHFDSPTQQQKIALLAMADFVKEDNPDDFLVLSGAAGTGKSSIMSALVELLNQKDIAYQIAAPTGRAARIIGRKTGTLASTMHSLIYTVQADPKTGVVHFKRKPTDDDTRTIFIIDEASMISSQANREENTLFVAPDSLLSDFAKHMKGCNSLNKVIFLGDHYQLPPIEETESRALQPEYLHQTFQWKGQAYFLTEVKRQEDGSRILKNATQLREAVQNGGKPSVDAPRVGNNVWQTAQHYVNNMQSNGIEGIISIGRTHRQNRVFNDAVREKMFGNQAGLVRQGDLLLMTQNWKRNGHVLYNGDHVVVEEVNLDKTEVAGGIHFCTAKLRYRKLDGTEETLEDYILLDCLLPDDGKLNAAQEKALRHERYTKNKRYRESGNAEDDKYMGAIRLMYGYAITCNKAQGGEWEKVYVNTFSVYEAKWLYTAVTRSRQELFQY